MKKSVIVVKNIFKQVGIIESYLSFKNKHEYTKHNLQEKYDSKCDGKLKK